MKTEAETGMTQLLQAKDASNCQKLGRRKEGFHSKSLQKEHTCVDPVILGFWPPEL